MADYHMDERSIDLDAIQKRLETTDLIPSQMVLLDGLPDKIAALQKAELACLADLRIALKSPKTLAALSKQSGIDTNYLQVLRRTLNGFFPKPRPLNEFAWLDPGLLASLKKAGMANSQILFEATCNGVSELAKETGADAGDLEELGAIANLCRIQWVSPSYGRVLLAAGTANAAAVAKADPQALCQAVADANKVGKFFKGAVGLRDIGRLVQAAAYVP